MPVPSFDNRSGRSLMKVIVTRIQTAFSMGEKAMPECTAVITQWRQQKPWLNTLNGAINALNAGQLDSAEALAKRSLILDRKAPYAYSVLGSIAKSRKNYAAASDYWTQTIAAA